MSDPLDRASCACLPAADLARLGPLRARGDVRVLPDGERLWAFWPAPDVELARRLLALPGAALFEHEGGLWRPLGSRLPVFDVPDPERAQSLPALLSPAPLEAEPPGPAGWSAVGLRLVRDDHARPASGLLFPLPVLSRWAEWATSHQLAGLSAARSDRKSVV